MHGTENNTVKCSPNDSRVPALAAFLPALGAKVQFLPPPLRGRIDKFRLSRFNAAKVSA